MGGWNLKLIRGPIVLFVLALSAAGAMVLAAEDFWVGIDREYKRERDALRASQSRYRTVDDEKEAIAQYLPRFVMLRDAGIVGDERRLQWVETLRRVARELRLPVLRYSLGSREPLEPMFTMPPGTYTAHASEMSLEVGLLHEADLLRLIAALDRDVEGLFDVSECRLQLAMPYEDLDRVEEVEETPTDVATIGAVCVLRWLTLTTPEAEQGT